MDYQECLMTATEALINLQGNLIDIITISRPKDVQEVMELSKILSKLSPLIGNLIEYSITRHLNENKSWPIGCHWIRQDPGFPDTILKGFPGIEPGIEVKTWFPLSTEITARFRDSQRHLQDNHIKVVLVCWMLDKIVFGKPQIINIWVGDAIDVAKARDQHYHNPPYYLVMEPEDTSKRTKNLQQTNCNGLKFQGNQSQLNDALELVESWGDNFQTYSQDRTYQGLLRQLMERFPYRLDTNFAKMDRILLPSLESFKKEILGMIYLDRPIQSWAKSINSQDEKSILSLLN